MLQRLFFSPNGFLMEGPAEIPVEHVNAEPYRDDLYPVSLKTIHFMNLVHNLQARNVHMRVCEI